MELLFGLPNMIFAIGVVGVYFLYRIYQKLKKIDDMLSELVWEILNERSENNEE